MRRRTRGAFTLVEAVIAMTLLTIVVGVFVSGLAESRALFNSGSSNVDLRRDAGEALRAFIGTLQSSGAVTVSGNTYPAVFAAGAAPAAFVAFNDAGPNDVVPATFPAGYQGASDTIVFKIPRDLDLDGLPMATLSDGSIEWTEVEYGFLVRPGSDGVNELVLRVHNPGALTIPSPPGLPTRAAFAEAPAGQTFDLVLARHVERLEVVVQGSGSLTRVTATLYLARRTGADDYVRAEQTSTIWLRNEDPS